MLADPDPAKRLDAAKPAQELLAQDDAVPPDVSPHLEPGTRADVAGYSYYPDALIRFQDLSRAK